MGRTPLCRTKGGLNRGTWTTKEDTILLEYIRTHGEGGWTKLPQNAGLNRCGKSCRLRWLNYLRPDIKRGDISPDEDDLIIQMHNLLGNRWSLIAGRLPNRTDNEIKNYWNSHLSKKLAMNKSQQNKQILMTGSTIPSPLQNQVFKPTPVKITTADSRHSEKVRPNGCNGYGGNHGSYEVALKLPDAKETANLSKSEWCDLVVEKMITDDESERIASETADVNLVGTEVTNSTYPLSSLADQQSPHSHHFVVNLDQGLMDFNELSSPYCNLLFSPSNYSLPEFGLDEFYTEQASLTTETNELEDICSDESNMLFHNPRLSKDSTISVD